MTCDAQEQGMALAVLCEHTKANADCFPAVGIIFACILGARLMLLHHIFYQLLPYGVLLDFEAFSPLRDPAFLILLWATANAFANVGLNIWWSHLESASVSGTVKVASSA